MPGFVLDIAVAVVAVLLLLFGAWRGLYKLIFGLVSALLALVLTLVCVAPLTDLVVKKTTLDERLTNALDAPLSKSVAKGGTVIYYGEEDENGARSLVYTGEDDKPHPFGDLLAGSPYAIFAKIIEKVVSDKLSKLPDDPKVTLINALSSTLVGYLVLAIIFVVLLIIFVILVKLLMRLVKKIVTHTYFAHFVDKLAGAVAGLAIAMIIIWGALAVVKVLGSYKWIVPVNNVITSSTLTKMLFENNVIYNLLVNSFNIREVIGKIIGITAAGKA